MPQLCNFGSAVVLKDRVYIVGGFQQSCMCYDPALGQWNTLSRCKYEHAGGSALVWKDRILVCGGRSGDVDDDEEVDTGEEEEEWEEDGTAGTSVIEEYDPESDTWVVSQVELRQRISAHFVFSTENDYITQCYPVPEDRTDIPSSRQAVLIGDATIERLHTVTTSDRKSVAVHAQPGATFSEISKELDRVEIVTCVGKMFLVCGLQEAGNKQRLGKIKAKLIRLLLNTKDLCESLKVSSILPSAKPNKRINQLNGLIRNVCRQLGVDFVDNDKNFLLSDDTRDRAAFRGHTNVWTARGILRLMGNMDLGVPCLQTAMGRW